MKKFDIVVVGDCNIDLIFNRYKKIPSYGEEVLAQQFDVVLGSSAGITAAHLAALGARVAYIGAVGADGFGRQFKELMTQQGVNTDYMVEKPAYKTGCTVVMSHDEERANLTYAGAMEHLMPSDVPRKLIEQTAYLHISNPYVLPFFKNVLPDFFKFVRSKGVHTSLDPQWDVNDEWDTDLRALLPYLDVFFPNEKELHFLLSGNKIKASELPQLCHHAIVSTQGSSGGQVIKPEGGSHFKSYLNKRVIDCIGAGDAFNAGFLAARIEGQSLEAAIDLACRNAALSTTVAGGTVSYTSREDFNNLFKKHFPNACDV
ncbi:MULTISPECIES: carbohydrate kinase family protein [unclassified Carboxylicivirga]|uniref:carbohydrate kinase family protein n=1 Tax=Carboxylicivirga TaxID=1628153 RepID=UPI003D351F37